MIFPVGAWHGTTHIEFRFHVVESDAHRPIGGAKIRVIDTSELRGVFDTNVVAKYPAAIADTNGLASVFVRCGAGGTDGIFGKKGRFSLSHELFVETDGYRPVAMALAEIAGGRRWPLSKQVFDVELLMSESP